MLLTIKSIYIYILNGINGTTMKNKNKAMFEFIPIIDQSME